MWIRVRLLWPTLPCQRGIWIGEWLLVRWTTWLQVTPTSFCFPVAHFLFLFNFFCCSLFKCFKGVSFLMPDILDHTPSPWEVKYRHQKRRTQLPLWQSWVPQQGRTLKIYKGMRSSALGKVNSVSTRWF